MLKAPSTDKSPHQGQGLRRKEKMKKGGRKVFLKRSRSQLLGKTLRFIIRKRIVQNKVRR